MPISDIVNITVSITGGALSVAGFGTMLITGISAPFAEGETEIYTTMTELDDAGWLGTEQEYLAAQLAFSSAIRPDRVKVAHLADFVAQVDNVTIDTAADGTYTLDINGTDFAHVSSSETTTDIRDALVVLVNAGDEPVTAAPVLTDELDLTADNAGEPFITTLEGDQSANMTLLLATPNTGYQQGLNTIELFDDDWYGLYGVDDDDWHILERAVWTETRNKLHMASSDDADITDVGVTDDIASVLQTASYARTAIIYHDQTLPGTGEHIGAAWMANRLAVDLDQQSPTWALVNLPGITAQSLTTTLQSGAEGKNASHYPTYAGTAVTYKGRVAEGTAIELIVVADWLQARLTEAHQATLIEYSARGAKVPYTNDGIAQTESDARGVIERAIGVGHILGPGDPDTEPTYTFPRRAEVSSADVLAEQYSYQINVTSSGKILNINGSVFLAQS